MPGRSRPWNLYPRNRSSRLDPRLFRNPPAEYRGAPFWSWNNRLHLPQLFRQIEHFRAMGFGGVHIHARTGLATKYLGPDFMSAVKACVHRLARRGMRAWLYDEDRWPSGFAGGMVSRDEGFRERTLLFTRRDEPSLGRRLARYAVELRDGRLHRYRRLSDSSRQPKGDTWQAFLRVAEPEAWFNGQTYIDTFNRAAVERFIAVTHERYRGAVGAAFGATVPAIFTDEPHFTKKQTLARAADPADVVLPFTDDFGATFRAQYGFDLLDRLPELIWDNADNTVSVARYCYHDHTAERFAAAFGDTLARWCGRHGIALTGHMLSEATLFGQTRAVGEAMRGLRAFQLPGIDILEDKLELTTAKQAQSVARQAGRPGVLSELYGVTGWHFDFAGHKRQGDWQAALGVTVRVPHLAWVSMAGESKRDYPAAIGYQSPWFREYRLIEDHFARLATVLTRGRPMVRVAVIHPIESLWLAWGPADQNRDAWQRRERQFADLTAWLTFGGIDFDFASEASLARAPTSPTGGAFVVGRINYDAVIVPNLRTIRATTLKRLEQFRSAGGKVIFLSDPPDLVDAKPSPRPRRLAQRCERVAFDERAVLAALELVRLLSLTAADGSPTTTIAHQLRADGKEHLLFLCNTDRRRTIGEVHIALQGRWAAERLDTFTGRMSVVPARCERDQTIVRWWCEAHDHLLLRMTPPGRSHFDTDAEDRADASTAIGAPLGFPLTPAVSRSTGRGGVVPITLSEPNVLLLDQAEWRLEGDAAWQPLDEVLRIDNLARARLGLPPRRGRDVQPWADTAPDPLTGRLHLRFAIRSAVRVRSSKLAIEDPRAWSITFDGKPVGNKPAGWWVDEAIRTVALPSFGAGSHLLELAIPMRRRTNVEWCYLLGDFGVRLRGRRATLTAPVRHLRFGDWTTQGLPFYAGNVTYHLPLRGDGRELSLCVPEFANPLLVAGLDGRRVGPIAFAPYRISLGRLRGRHRLDLTAYGNRHNAFGPLHHANPNLTWIGPAAWRSTGDAWTDEYVLKPMGVLRTPVMSVSGE